MHIDTPEEVRRQDESAARADASPERMLARYNEALEARLLEVRSARGYTDRDPALYAGSTVPRWAQDAVDWTAFRDRVMLYGLDVENKYAAGEPVPSLDDFKAVLASMDCDWTYNITED